MKRVILYGMCLVMLLSACNNEKQKAPVGENKFESLLYDYHMALAMARAAKDSTEYKEHLYANAALMKHGVTQAEFDSSLIWYATHTEKLYNIYERLQKRLDKEALVLGANPSFRTAYNEANEGGDTVNIWNGASFYSLTSNSLSKRMTFTIPADSSFKPNDRFIWQFHPHFVYRSGARDAIVSLTLTYENDSVSTTYQRLYSDEDFEIRIEAGKTLVKQISGFVYHRAAWDKNEKLLFLFYPTLLRCHQSIVETEPTDTSSSTDSLNVQSPLSTDTLLPLPEKRMNKLPDGILQSRTQGKFRRKEMQ